MNCTTEFEGSFTFNKPLNTDQIAYLKKFSKTRRMKRNPNLIKTKANSLREKVGLPLGEDAEFYISGKGPFGQNPTKDVVNKNIPPSNQPGFWCQWEPSDDGSELKWDEGEKFYNYTKWLIYMLEKFFIPWGYVLNGEVKYEGERSNNIGVIIINNNVYLQECEHNEDEEIIGNKPLLILREIKSNKLE